MSSVMAMRMPSTMFVPPSGPAAKIHQDAANLIEIIRQRLNQLRAFTNVSTPTRVVCELSWSSKRREAATSAASIELRTLIRLARR